MYDGVQLFKFSICFKNFKWIRSIVSIFSKPHTSHPYNNTGITTLSKRSNWHSTGKLNCLIFLMTSYIAFCACSHRCVLGFFERPWTWKNNSKVFELIHTCSFYRSQTSYYVSLSCTYAEYSSRSLWKNNQCFNCSMLKILRICLISATYFSNE